MSGCAKEKTAANDPDPIWHHTMDSQLYKECAWSYCLKRAINLTASDGAFELAMKTAKVQTVSVCVNDYHKAQLTTRLELLTLRAMCDSTKSDHEPPLAALFSGTPATLKPKPGVPNPTPAPKPAPPPKLPATPSTPANLLAEMQAQLLEIKNSAAATGTGGRRGTPPIEPCSATYVE